MKIFLRLFFVSVLFYSVSANSQDARRVDSIRSLVETDKADTNKVNHLNLLVEDLQFIWKDCEPLIRQQIELSRKLKFWKGEAKAYRQLGWCYQVLSEYRKSADCYDTAMSIYQKYNYKIGIAGSYVSKGSIADKIGLLNEAHRYYLNAMNIYEQEHYEKGISSVLINIANIQSNNGELDKATSNMLKALSIILKLKELKSEGICYSNLGNYQMRRNRTDSAMYYYQKSLAIKLKMGDIRGEAASYSRISGALEKDGRFLEAVDYSVKAVEIFSKLNDKSKTASRQIELGKLKMKLNNIPEAIKLFEVALNTGDAIKDIDIVKDACYSLANAFDLKKEAGRALKYYRQYELLHDSVNNSEVGKQIARNEVSYRYEKEMLADSLRNSEKEKDMAIREEERLAKQRIISTSAIGGFVLILIIAFMFFKSSRQKQKDNFLLEEKNQIIEMKSKILEEKNKDITDSIKYARYIQNTILPPVEYIKQHLPNTFIYYQPKDIVSGDFYFIKKKKQYLYIAAVDCTGHGVPGAFMSIVANNLLHQAIAELDTPTPSEILNHIESRAEEEIDIVSNSEKLKDGMDISICRIDKTNLLFSGANNPLYTIDNEALSETKGTKASIAVFQPSGKNSFSDVFVTLNKNTTCYIFTDGFADQFGGENGKKFKYARLKEELLKVNNLELEKQKDYLAEVFNTWKGSLEQVDDVLLIAFKA